MKKFNLEPITDMLSDETSPDVLAKIIDGLILDYILILLLEPNREIEKAIVFVQIEQLRNLRDKLFECKAV